MGFFPSGHVVFVSIRACVGWDGVCHLEVGVGNGGHIQIEMLYTLRAHGEPCELTSYLSAQQIKG